MNVRFGSLADTLEARFRPGNLNHLPFTLGRLDVLLEIAGQILEGCVRFVISRSVGDITVYADQCRRLDQATSRYDGAEVLATLEHHRVPTVVHEGHTRLYRRRHMGHDDERAV